MAQRSATGIKVLGLLGLLSAFVFAGCGGSGDGDPATDATKAAATTTAKDGQPDAKPLSKAVFLKRADQICQDAGDDMRNDIQSRKTEYGMGFGAQPNMKQREEVVTDLMLPVITRQIEEIAALGPPRGEEQRIGAIITALEEGVSKTEADPSLALKRPNPFDKASKLSQKYGFKKCG